MLRKTLGEKGVIVDNNNETIKLQYLIELEKVQKQEGLRLGNKLKKAHIQRRQQEMKVNLVAQYLSFSVADAIEYCSNAQSYHSFKALKLPLNSYKSFNYLFKVLNSRLPLQVIL